MENEFPPNSHASKERSPARSAEKTPETKDVPRIVTGKVVQRKKPLHKKFFEAFRPEDGVGFVEHTVLEVLIPGIKGSMADAATTAIEDALGVGRGPRRRGNGSYTSYNRMSEARPRRGRERDRDDERRPRRDAPRTSHDHREHILDSRVEAEEVIDMLNEMISMYDVATRRDLLSMLGEPHEFTDVDWGWTDLRGARVHKIREGYLLDLPRAVPLD